MSGQRLVVDLLYLTGRRGGTETYARELVTRLPALLPGVELVALTNTTGDAAVREWFPGRTRTLPVDGENRVLWAAAETFLVERAARREGAALLWCPANFGPRARRVPLAVTVHDVIAEDFPNPEVSPVTQQVTRWIIRRAARSATTVLTVSEDSALAIARALGVPGDRVVVAPNGHADPLEVTDPAGELAALGVPDDRPLVLSTGNRMPHKNFPTLVRSLAEMPKETRPLLAVTGSHGEDPLAPLVAELGLQDDVLLLGWVTRAQLEALYRRAEVYVCPSLVEGFGLPVVDAMARGCPVVASDVGALREVGGDAARYVDPTSPASIAAAVGELLADPAERARLTAAGLARAKEFTWDAAAAVTAGALGRALAART